MIRLNPHCLIFRTAGGENIPCPAEVVTVELIGESAQSLDPDLIHNASAAVLHYFREDLGRETVTVAEFSVVLERVLRGFGLTVKRDDETPETGAEETDLNRMASRFAEGGELLFFTRLREEIRHCLAQSPHRIRFVGLRGCVKRLSGARRWNHRCRDLSDQIVEYLRGCLAAEGKSGDCSLTVI